MSERDVPADASGERRARAAAGIARARRPLASPAMQKLFVAPAVVWILTFTVFPLLYSAPKSFLQRYREGATRIERQRWIGFSNYRQALEDGEIRRSMLFTSGLVVLSVAGEMVLGFVLAVAAHRSMARRLSQWPLALFAVPMLTAPVAVAYASLTFFEQSSGLVNLVLGLAVPAESLPRWRTTPGWSLLAIVLVDWWQWTPFCFLVLLASLSAIPAGLLEAADVEGAGPWRRVASILFPMLKPTLIVLLMLRLIEGLKVFDVPLVLTGGGPGTSTYTYTQWIWRKGLRDGSYELAAALAYLLLVPIMIAATVLVRRARSHFQPAFAESR